MAQAITKGGVHNIIPIIVGPYYKFYGCEPHVSISKGGDHVVISKVDHKVTITKGGPKL